MLGRLQAGETAVCAARKRLLMLTDPRDRLPAGQVVQSRRRPCFCCQNAFSTWCPSARAGYCLNKFLAALSGPASAYMERVHAARLRNFRPRSDTAIHGVQ